MARRMAWFTTPTALLAVLGRTVLGRAPPASRPPVVPAAGVVFIGP